MSIRVPSKNTALKYIKTILPDNTHYLSPPIISTDFGKTYVHGRDFKLQGGNTLLLDVTRVDYPFAPEDISRNILLYVKNGIMLNPRILNFYFEVFGKNKDNKYSLIQGKHYAPKSPKYIFGADVETAEAYASHLKE